MNENSLAAYLNPANKRKFESHKGIILRELRKRPGQHSYLIASRTGLQYEQVHKRIPELIDDGLVRITGIAVFYGNKLSEYSLVEQPELFTVKRKPVLRKWLKEQYPDIYHEFNATNK